MGADLLLTTLVHDQDKKLDWRKGREVARKLPIDLVQAAMVEIHGEPCETAREARTLLNEYVGDLKNELKNSSRDAHTWSIGGKTVHVRGGTSWGEDPSEGYAAFTNLDHFPQVLRAIGFEIDGGEADELDRWIVDHGEEVQVSYTVPVEATVNLREGTVTSVKAFHDFLALEGNVTTMESEAVEVQPVIDRAIEIADGDTEWPAWTSA